MNLKRNYRKWVSIPRLTRMFPDDVVAERWFVRQRWGEEVRCPRCNGVRVTENGKHPSMPYRCLDCVRFFSVRSGTVMQGSKLGYRIWLIAMYMMAVNPKGVSSVQLAKYLGITQKSAWHLMHRIRECWSESGKLFKGPVEVDETYVGGSDASRHRSKKRGDGVGGMVPVAGLRDRATGRVSALVVDSAQAEDLKPFVESRTRVDTVVYSEEFASYRSLDRPRESFAW